MGGGGGGTAVNDAYHHRRPVGPFNPAWCLGPPPITTTTITKEITNRRWWDDTTTTTTSSSSYYSYYSYSSRSKSAHVRRGSSAADEDPASPRVGCMGQIKRDDKPAPPPVARCESPPPPPAAARRRTGKLGRLRRILSGKIIPAAGMMIAFAVSPRPPPRIKSIAGDGERAFVAAEMDPPLPVTAARGGGEKEGVSLLWKRRCGGAVALGGLHIPQQQQLKICLCNSTAAAL